MNWLLTYISSSVGRKSIMALTGMCLLLFLIVHLIGNIAFVQGAKAFNSYSHLLMSFKFIYVAEWGLVFLFLAHVSIGMTLTVKNSMARPQGYFKKVRSGRGESLASSSMPYTGITIFIFIILHLTHFKYGQYYYATYDGVVMRDLYKLVVEFFSSPLNVLTYTFFMVIIGLHTGHGLWSLFQTLGISDVRYNGVIKKLSITYGIVICIGFSFFAVWAYLQRGNL